MPSVAVCVLWPSVAGKLRWYSLLAENDTKKPGSSRSLLDEKSPAAVTIISANSVCAHPHGIASEDRGEARIHSG
jgi:hypothetical protein